VLSVTVKVRKKRGGGGVVVVLVLYCLSLRGRYLVSLVVIVAGLQGMFLACGLVVLVLFLVLC